MTSDVSAIEAPSAPAAVDSRLYAIDRALEPLRWVFRWGSVAMLVAMVALPFVQVVAREVLSAATHPEACTVARRLTGRAISLQSFHIGPKILDWDAVAARPDHVVEVHPELALRRIAPDVVFAPKRSARGAGQRIAALARWIDVPAALAELPAGARLDDVLDALAAAWSARRFADGTHEELGADVDDRGRPMRVIV